MKDEMRAGRPGFEEEEKISEEVEGGISSRIDKLKNRMLFSGAKSHQIGNACHNDTGAGAPRANDRVRQNSCKLGKYFQKTVPNENTTTVRV